MSRRALLLGALLTGSAAALVFGDQGRSDVDLLGDHSDSPAARLDPTPLAAPVRVATRLDPVSDSAPESVKRAASVGADAQVPSPVVVGRVLDAAGRPVRGARVFASPVDDARPGEGERRAVTDDDGSFSLAGLTSAPHTITVLGGAAGSLVLTLRPELRAAEREFTLARSVAIAGRLRDDRGEPLAGVGVVATAASRFAEAADFLDEAVVPARTDAEGTFRVGLDGTEGEFLLRIEGAGRHAICVRMPAAERFEPSLTLPASGRVAGRLPQTEDRRVTLTLVGSWAIGFPTASRVDLEADAEGVFDVGGLLPGTWRIVAGGASVQVDVTPGGTGRVSM